MRKDFKNKVVVVTGSGSGIGRVTARAFCEQGAKVMLNGRTESKLKKLQEELSAQGYPVEYFVADVTDENASLLLAKHTISCFGKVDVLIANASVSMNTRFEDMAPGLFKLIADSNLYGAAMPASAFLPAIKESSGSIVFIGSLAGIHGMPGASAYSAGKMCLRGLQQSLEVELHGTGIHIGLVEPGFTENDEEKVLLSGDGEWKPVPARINLLKQSQRSVALAIVKAVSRRSRRRTLSVGGKILKVLAILSPFILRRILRTAR